MIIFSGQLDGFKSRGDGSTLITLDVYQQHRKEFGDIIKGGVGTEYIMLLIPTNEAETFGNETQEETRERFRKRMNAIINRIAELKRVDGAVYREEAKKLFREKGFIKDSTNELTIEGYARVIILLEGIQHDLE